MAVINFVKAGKMNYNTIITQIVYRAIIENLSSQSAHLRSWYQFKDMGSCFFPYFWAYEKSTNVENRSWHSRTIAHILGFLVGSAPNVQHRITLFTHWMFINR